MALAIALVLAGCGGGSSTSSHPLDGLTAKQVLARAQSATRHAHSVHFVAHVEESGKVTDVDFRLNDKHRVVGTFAVGGANLQVRLVGQYIYVKADRTFWQQSVGTAAAQLLTGKWLKAPVSDPNFGSFSDLASFDAIATKVLKSSGKFTRVAGKSVAGQRTVGLHDAGGSGGDKGTLYVSDASPAFPLLVLPDQSASSQGRVTFSEWNEPVTVNAPPSSQVVDASKLGG
jgi:hypothetical protein